MTGRALVCGFIRPDGMWRLIMVTAASPATGGSIMVTKKHGEKPEVTVFGDTELCNSTFIRLANECQTAGYRFYNQAEFPAPPFVTDPSVKDGFTVIDEWARDMSRMAVAFLGNGNERE